MRLVAVQEMYYGTKNLKVGEAFDAASDEDARILKGTGKAKDAPPKRQAPVKTRALKSTDDAPRLDDAKSSDDAGPGRYHRTDMRAED